MGFLSLFSKPDPGVQVLPSGTVTVDRNNNILATTVSSACSQEALQQIGDQVLTLFREARKAQLSLSELTLHFSSLKITARELRGGAIIFLAPKHSFNAVSH
ncbi:MAG TPA: hypothetical protein VFE51_00120 [Verrucomicrobiae bacterium]|nr:hypothetical protein [Verrucomicrobiae bacterium]